MVNRLAWMSRVRLMSEGHDDTGLGETTTIPSLILGHSCVAHTNVRRASHILGRYWST